MENETRKLATIRKIDELRPIEFVNKETGEIEIAQNIQLAILDGWQCVTLKSEFSAPGEYAVYFEIDAIIPRHQWNAHIQKDTPDKPIRLKTMKLCGQLSQGLALPITLFKGVYSEEGYDWIHIKDESTNVHVSFESVYPIGTDVTEELKIEKYEPPTSAELAGVSRGNFPGDIPKTDQARIQNKPAILKIGELEEPITYEVTEKLEGSSCTIYVKNGEFGVCSRNINLKESETNAFWETATRLKLNEKLPEFRDYIALQGELCGPGIQGNIYGLKEKQFFLYSIYDIREGRYWSPEERLEAVSVLGIKHVPIIELNYVPAETVAEVLTFAEGISKLANVQREGLVFKAHEGQDSWKAISNKYLLKQK